MQFLNRFVVKSYLSLLTHIEKIYMTQKRPLFIVIEGIDGCGKSTQIELLKRRFQEEGAKALETHEPTDSPIGMIIRNIMKGRIQTDQATIGALFAADRLDHINNPVNGMEKRMDEGYNIIASRYYFSSYAFQSEFVPIDWLVNMNSLAKSYLKPDVIFYINLDPVICNQRISASRADIEMYENLDKLTKTHEAYLKCFKDYGQDENIHYLDGTRSIEELATDIWEVVEALEVETIVRD